MQVITYSSHHPKRKMNHRIEASRILIMEPNMSGHRGIYLQWMIDGLVERGHSVTLMTFPESLKHPAFSHYARNAEGSITIAPAEHVNPDHHGGTAVSIRREFAYWRMFRQWYRQHKEKSSVDAVFLPLLDYCLYAIALLGSPFGKVPFVGITMRPSFHYPEMGIICPPPALGGVKMALFFRLLRNKSLRYLLSIDEPLIEFIRDRNMAASEKVLFLPEPCDLDALTDVNEAKRRMGIDPDHKVILVYGSLSSRKGVIELLRSISDSACQQLVDVVLAGKVEDRMREHLDADWIQAMQQDGRLKILDRFITSDEENMLFSAADIVWLGYREHYVSSGVLVQAACAGLPVIACKEGIIGWKTRRHKLGIVLDPFDTTSIAEAIVTLTDKKNLYFTENSNDNAEFKNRDIRLAKKILADCFMKSFHQ